jgi:hypothetical protein
LEKLLFLFFHSTFTVDGFETSGANFFSFTVNGFDLQIGVLFTQSFDFTVGTARGFFRALAANFASSCHMDSSW